MWLIPLFVIVGAGSVTFGLCNILLSEDRKRRLQAFLEEAWLRYADAGPAIVVKAPISVACRLVDQILGKKNLSRRSFLGMFAVTAAIQMLSLYVLGLGNGHPLGIERWPMQEFAKDKVPSTSELPEVTTPEERVARELLENSLLPTTDRWLRAPDQRWLHNALLALAMLCLPAGLSAVSWMISRKMLQKMLKAEDGWDIMANFSLNLLFLITSITVVSGILAFVLIPLARSLYILLFVTLLHTQGLVLFFGFGGHLFLSVGSIFYGQSRFLVTLGVCFAPSLFVGALLIIAGISRLVRIPTFRALNYLFLRMVQFKGGALAFLATFAGAITATIGIILKIV